jgi:sirohydrochlorin ferrochelatase
VPQALERLRAAGAPRIAVASWFLAPGLLPDKVHRQARNTVLRAAPMGADSAVAEIIADRYQAAARSVIASRSA